MPLLRQALIPVAVLLACSLIAWVMLRYPAKPQERQASADLPTVKVMTVQPETTTVTVRSQGLVQPWVQIDLSNRVAGTVLKVHPALLAHGLFRKDEVLVRLDPQDYDVAVTEAEAQLADAKKEWQRELAEADQAKGEWQALGQGKAEPYVLHIPQLAAAKAQVKSAEAKLAQARLNRERTAIKAPFTGRVRDSQGVAPGQHVNADTVLARIYPTHKARLRLPVMDEDLAFIGLPLGIQDKPNNASEPINVLTETAGQPVRWTARFVALDGALDETTRLRHVITEIDDPFALNPPEQAGGTHLNPPLALGQWVQAELPGRSLTNVFVLPPIALQGDGTVLVVACPKACKPSARVRTRKVGVIWREAGRVLINAGLEAGERVVVSALENAVDGQQVVIQEVP